MTMRKLIECPDDFKNQLAIWYSKGMAMSGFEVVKCRTSDGDEYEPVVYDYFDPDVGYVNKGGPYKTWRGAFAAIGQAFDQIENM